MLYKAFISYSHAADGKLAPALQHALHRIAKPWYRLRTMRVFRDQTNLAASPGLWTEIEQALRESAFFIYLASPAAAKSLWVQREVDWWLTNRSSETFLIALTDGVILWDNAAQDLDWSATTALPQRLAKAFGEEPLHTDIRWAHGVDQLSLRHSQFRAAILELAATLLDRPKDELDGDDVRQYRRTRRVAWSAAGVLACLLVVTSLAAWLATQQSLLATSRSLAARSEAVLPTNPELALLLAREALRFSKDEQADYALRRAFLRNPQRMLHHSPGGTLVAKFVGSDLVVAAEPGKRPLVWSVSQGDRKVELPNDADDRLAALSVSAGQPLFAVSAEDNTFALYDTKTLQILTNLPGTGPRFSRDGKVLTAWEGNEIRQWSVPPLQARKVAASLQADYVVRDVSPDGSLLMLAKAEEISPVVIVEALSGHVLAKWPELTLREGTGFTPDGRFIVAEGTDGFELLEPETGRKVRTLERPGFGDIGWTTYVAVSPDGKIFVSGNRNGAVNTWSLETGEWAGVNDTIHRLDIRSIEFSPDGGNMLSVAADGNACLWDTASMRCLVVLGGEGDDAWDVGFAADSRHFLTTHLDGTVRIWNRETWYPSSALSASGAVAGDAGRLVLGAVDGGRLQLWDIATGKVKTTLEPNAGEINGMVLDRQGTLIAIAPAEGAAELWSVQTRKRAVQLGGASEGATALAFTSDGSELVTGSEDGWVRFWSTNDGSPIGEWQASQERVMDIVAHADGKRIAIATWDGRGRVHDMKSGAILLEAKLDEDGAVAQSVALNADGTLLFFGGDRFPQIWDLAAGTRKQTLAGHSDEVFDGAFSEDGKFLLSGSGFMHSRGEPPDNGNAAHLWDAQSGRLLLSYLSAGYVVRMVSFSNDGTSIIAGSDDGEVRRYECEVCLPLPRLVGLVSSRLARGLSNEERERYLSQSSLLGWIAGRQPSR